MRKVGEIRVPVERIETGAYVPDSVAEFFDCEKTAAVGRLYGVLQWVLGLDDEIDQVIINGRDDRGRKYRIKVVYEE